MNQVNILVRRQDNELPAVWISENYLLQLLPTLSETYLRVKARPSYKASVLPCHRSKSFLPITEKSWRWGKQNGTVYYDYDFIPNKAPQFFKDKLPARAELIASKKEADTTKELQPFENFIKPYYDEHYQEFLPYYCNYSDKQRFPLAKAAAIVKGAKDYIFQNNINPAKKVFFETLSQYMSSVDGKYLPLNARCLQRLIKSSIESNSNPVKLPRSENNNAAKFKGDGELESWIIQMRMSGRNYTDQHIVRKVQYMCHISNKEVPSERWIESLMAQHNHKWLTAPTRFGEKGRLGRMYRGYIPLSNALYAGDCWQVDGTRVNLIDFKLSDKNVFLYIVAVRDVHSGDVLGYAFDISENRWVVHQALKMAVEETGYLPYQLVMDRFPGHNTTEMEALFSYMRNLGVKIDFAHKASGKANLERWFSTMQQVFMQGSDYYYGEGVQSRNKFAHRSKEELKKMKLHAKENGWNYDAACDEAAKMIEAYRSTKLSYYSKKYKTIEKSPAELHATSEKPNVIITEAHNVFYLFALRTQRKFEGEGLLTIQIHNQHFDYRCSDPAVVSKYERVMICYNLEDLSTVHLYEISDKPVKKYLGSAKEVSVQMYGPDAQFGKLVNQQAILANMAAERERQLTMKLAAGDDVTMLLQGDVSKDAYENAETVYLQNQWQSNEDNTTGYDIRDQYS